MYKNVVVFKSGTFGQHESLCTVFETITKV